MKNIVGIIGSYREQGINDQVVSEILAGAAEAGANTRRVFLPNADIQFCTNCRACMQEPGETPGRCVIDDEMRELLDACVQADGLVLASPHNMGTVTAVFKRFMERFAPLGYWPWGVAAPKQRKATPAKSAIIVLSSAAPSFIWKMGGYTAEKTMRYFAKMLGAKSVRVLKYGMISMKEQPELTDSQRAKARKYGRWLASR